MKPARKASGDLLDGLVRERVCRKSPWIAFPRVAARRDDRRYAIDETRARTELGYAPARDFHDGLAATLAWYLDNEPWWRAVMDGSYRQWLDRNYGARALNA